MTKLISWLDSDGQPNSGIVLTRAAVKGEQIVVCDVLEVKTCELLAYAQEQGFTRLYLRGRRVVEVAEPSQDIDRLVRSAKSAPLSAAA